MIPDFGLNPERAGLVTGSADWPCVDGSALGHRPYGPTLRVGMIVIGVTAHRRDRSSALRTDATVCGWVIRIFALLNAMAAFSAGAFSSHR